MAHCLMVWNSKRDIKWLALHGADIQPGGKSHHTAERVAEGQSAKRH